MRISTFRSAASIWLSGGWESLLLPVDETLELMALDFAVEVLPVNLYFLKLLVIGMTIPKLN